MLMAVRNYAFNARFFQFVPKTPFVQKKALRKAKSVIGSKQIVVNQRQKNCFIIEIRPDPDFGIPIDG